MLFKVSSTMATHQVSEAGALLGMGFDHILLATNIMWNVYSLTVCSSIIQQQWILYTIYTTTWMYTGTQVYYKMAVFYLLQVYHKT